MNKRYQVFISSTFEDLQEERKTVIQILLENDFIPCGMELFPASNEEQWSFIKSVIDDCDYYLLIIGGRYGSTNKDGISYTQMEYEYARSKNKPIIAFIHKNPNELQKGKTGKTIKGQKALEQFKNEVKECLVKYWESKEELISSVVTSIHQLTKRFPSAGWVKANTAVDADDIHEVLRLQKENKHLRDMLEQSDFSMPVGIDELAQGNEQIALTCTEPLKHKLITVNTTWNKIFAAFAPTLLIDGTEIAIRFRINEMLSKIISPDDNPYDTHIQITQESLGMILLQFKALGMITIRNSEFDIPLESSGITWLLTSYGEKVLTQLSAIRRK